MNSQEAYEVISSVTQNIGKYSSSFTIYNVSIWNLFLQSLYDFLTADRKMFEKRIYNKKFLIAMLKNSLVENDIKSILSFSPSTSRRYFEGNMFHIFLDWLFLKLDFRRIHNVGLFQK